MKGVVIAMSLGMPLAQRLQRMLLPAVAEGWVEAAGRAGSNCEATSAEVAGPCCLRNRLQSSNTTCLVSKTQIL